MSTQKRFLVLGIGNAQVDILRYLKYRGDIEIYALSNTSKGRGYELADFFDEIDITDRESVLGYAISKNIDFIYSVGSDVAMPTVSWVSSKMGLKSFVDYETAKVCNTKHLFREKLKETYGAVKYELLEESLKIKNIDFPAIVKPVDSQGQRGVSTVYSESDLKKAYNFAVNFSRREEVIIEEKIMGEEISVNAFMVKGEMIFCLPSGRKSWEEYDGGIIHKHILPLDMDRETISNIKHLVLETVSALKIEDGPVYFQIKIVEKQPYLIEVTPRLDGCHMWHLIKSSTGIDLLDMTLCHIMEEPIEIVDNYFVKASILEFLCQSPNEVFSSVKKDSSSLYEEYYYDIGDKVKEMNGSMEKCGYKIVLKES